MSLFRKIFFAKVSLHPGENDCFLYLKSMTSFVVRGLLVGEANNLFIPVIPYPHLMHLIHKITTKMELNFPKKVEGEGGRGVSDK